MCQQGAQEGAELVSSMIQATYLAIRSQQQQQQHHDVSIAMSNEHLSDPVSLSSRHLTPDKIQLFRSSETAAPLLHHPRTVFFLSHSATSSYPSRCRVRICVYDTEWDDGSSDR